MSTHDSCWIVCKMIFTSTRIVRPYCMDIQAPNAVQCSFHRHARMRTRICTVSILQSMPFITRSDCCQRKKGPLNLCCKWQNQSHTFNGLSFIFFFNIQQDPVIRITEKKMEISSIVQSNLSNQPTINHNGACMLWTSTTHTIQRRNFHGSAAHSKRAKCYLSARSMLDSMFLLSAACAMCIFISDNDNWLAPEAKIQWETKTSNKKEEIYE